MRQKRGFKLLKRGVYDLGVVFWWGDGLHIYFF